MIVAFSVSPSGLDHPDGSVHDAVAAAVRVVRDSGLPFRTSSMFTEIEGDWDEVMDVVKRATAAVGAYGTRISLVLKADIRPGRTGELTGKIDRLQKAISAQDAEATSAKAPLLARDARPALDGHDGSAGDGGDGAREARDAGGDGDGAR